MRVATGHNQAFRPAVELVKSLLDDGIIGDIHRISVTCTFRLQIETTDLGWRADARHTGGGELIDSGIHPVYLLLHLMGDEPRAVSAMLSNGRRGFMDREDSAQVLVRFDGGAVGHVSTSWASQDAEGSELITIAGSHGALSASDAGVLLLRDDGTSERFELRPPDTFTDLIRDFSDAVAAGRPARQDEQAGAAAVRVVLAAYEADTSGTTVLL
ncbi:Gfo/Idh/MocA family protein [uncultured Microbacterium sp.]|uniref:Gfo/Idh/MocA family protein n=1 Tax=uncultured Microbacterium sp. TaxID=191216 RepID=UPI0035CB1965